MDLSYTELNKVQLLITLPTHLVLLHKLLSLTGMGKGVLTPCLEDGEALADTGRAWLAASGPLGVQLVPSSGQRYGDSMR